MSIQRLRTKGERWLCHPPETCETTSAVNAARFCCVDFHNDILKGVFSTHLISAVKYFCVGEAVWMRSQTLTHSLIKPPSARGVQSDLLSVMLGRNERMTTICRPAFFLLF